MRFQRRDGAHLILNTSVTAQQAETCFPRGDSVRRLLFNMTPFHGDDTEMDSFQAF